MDATEANDYLIELIYEDVLDALQKEEYEKAAALEHLIDSL